MILLNAKLYTFHRGDQFYPVCLGNDEDVMEHVRLNPGTTEVRLFEFVDKQGSKRTVKETVVYKAP